MNINNDININQVLNQMRVLAAQAQSKQNVDAVQQTGATQGLDFSTVLKSSVDTVNSLSKTSGDLKKRMEMGDPSVNLVDVTIASEKAKLAMTAMTEVRNKLVQAYKDVMSMSM